MPDSKSIHSSLEKWDEKAQLYDLDIQIIDLQFQIWKKV